MVTTRGHTDTKCYVVVGGKGLCVTLFQQQIGRLLIAQSPAIELHLLLFQQWNTTPSHYIMSTREQIKHLTYHILNKMLWVALDICL